jgi:cytochrome c biogenesis protein CcdA
MEYLLISFIAGILTVLAPCVLPILPVVLGSSLQKVDDRSRPLIITISLAVSILIFTLLLKVSTIFIMIDPRVWQGLSGGIILFFGIITIFPDLWARIETGLKLDRASGGLLQKSSRKQGVWGSILMGASLGPVFASCSPTYFVILAVVLPQNFFVGLLNLIVYCLGHALILGVVALLGQRFLSRIRWIVDPTGWFKKALGVLFILLGLAIMTGFEKKIETALLDAGFLDLRGIEVKLLEKTE